MIAPITLQGLLYNFYGYGPEDSVVELLDGIKATANKCGFQARFKLFPDYFTIEYIGTFRRRKGTYKWSHIKTMSRDVLLREIEITLLQNEYNGWGKMSLSKLGLSPRG
jgi:hypothetical protein